MTHQESLESKVNETKAMVKFQLKKVLCMGVAVGNCSMEEKQIFQNVQMSVNFLVSLLKKNWQNVSSLKTFLVFIFPLFSGNQFCAFGVCLNRWGAWIWRVPWGAPYASIKSIFAVCESYVGEAAWVKCLLSIMYARHSLGNFPEVLFVFLCFGFFSFKV